MRRTMYKLLKSVHRPVRMELGADLLTAPQHKTGIRYLAFTSAASCQPSGLQSSVRPTTLPSGRLTSTFSKCSYLPYSISSSKLNANYLATPRKLISVSSKISCLASVRSFSSSSITANSSGTRQLSGSATRLASSLRVPSLGLSSKGGGPQPHLSALRWSILYSLPPHEKYYRL